MSTSLQKRVQIPSAWLAEFCERHHVERLSLFGSVLRDDFHKSSDVDVLVEFQSGVAVGYFAMMRMQRELSDKLKRPVDLRTPAELSKQFRNRILAEADIQYVHR